MSVNAYLTKVAMNSILRDERRREIKTSLNYINANLFTYFGDNISERMVFGSYTRNTILPKTLDIKADVDLMVVFKNTGFQPQSYLNSLRSFVSQYYSKSENKQAHPTIKLNLNHITFELVPAIKNWIGTYYIPEKASSWSNWQVTDPNDFNNDLTRRNKQNSNLTKPLVRVLKYWNAQNGYPFESYELEQQIIACSPPIFHCYNNLGEYFYDCVQELSSPPNGWAQIKQTKLDRLKTLSASAKLNEKLGSSENAIKEIKKLSI